MKGKSPPGKGRRGVSPLRMKILDTALAVLVIKAKYLYLYPRFEYLISLHVCKFVRFVAYCEAVGNRLTGLLELSKRKHSDLYDLKFSLETREKLL